MCIYIYITDVCRAFAQATIVYFDLQRHSIDRGNTDTLAWILVFSLILEDRTTENAHCESAWLRVIAVP